MTASLKVRNGVYQMVFSYKDSCGKWKQRCESTGLKEKGNKRKAETLMKERLAELEALAVKQIETSNILFLDAMEEWLNDVMVTQVRENTLDEYKRVFNYHIKTYPKFRNLPLQDLTPAILQQYYNAKLKDGLSPNTLLKQHANLSKFLKYALSLDMISQNPAERVTRPKKITCTSARFYTIEQLQSLLQLFHGDLLEPVVVLTANLGLRRSEICGLRWDAIDFETKKIHVRYTAIVVNGKHIYSDNTKSKSSKRTLPMSDTLYEFLKHIRAEQAKMKLLLGKSYVNTGFVCTKPDGSPIDPDFVTKHFHGVLEKSPLPNIRFHDLRHSAASMLHACGYDLKDIQMWLGHSDIQTTGNIYMHLDDKRLNHMAEAMGNALNPKRNIG